MTGVLRALGLCRRAGALICGTPMVCAELPKGRTVLVLEASDTSEATHKRITDKCDHYSAEHIRLRVGGDVLAAAVGKTGFLAAVSVTDKNLGLLVRKALEEDENS